MEKKNYYNNIRVLIETARQEMIEVVYIAHDGGEGDELAYGSEGWQIEKSIRPLVSEQVIDKQCNSAFKETKLDEYLHSKQVKDIILVGLQSEYCIDTTCKVAFEYGYQIIIPKGATSTFDNEYFTGIQIATYYEQKIWNHRFAEVVEMKDALHILRSK